MEIDKISCSQLGINGLRKIMSQYRIPTKEVERKQILNKEYENLFLHNLVYPYGVARKYYIHWISKEELIDESIIGFRKGLNKYLEQERSFRVGAYVVWWCQKYCIEKVIRKIWELSIQYEERNIPKRDIEHIISKIQLGDIEQLHLLKEHYAYLFEDIDKKYVNTGVFPNEDLKNKVISRAINRDVSLEILKGEQYENLKNELEFEDIILLEYSLSYEKEIKAILS